MAGKIDSTNLKSYTINPNDNLFTGVWNLNQNNLTQYDPYISGYAFIVWTKLPQFMDADTVSRLGDEKSVISNTFRMMTEKNFKSLSGIGDITLGVDDINHGFAGNAYGVATGISKENTSFSMTHQELAGSPMRKLYEYWITGIRDPETGLATYHGLIPEGKLDYSARNHTGELLYIVTDPSGGANGIEFACYYTNVMPTKIPQDHLNFSNGEHAVAEVSIDFRGNYHASEQINELAKNYLRQKLLTTTFSEYDPKIPVAEYKREKGYYDPNFSKEKAVDLTDWKTK